MSLFICHKNEDKTAFKLNVTNVNNQQISKSQCVQDEEQNAVRVKLCVLAYTVCFQCVSPTQFNFPSPRGETNKIQMLNEPCIK